MSLTLETNKILIGASDDLKSVLNEYIKCMVQSHLEGWGSRYEGKSETDVSFDLTVNYDPSDELEMVEEWLSRELTTNDIEIIIDYFKESVLDELFDRLNN